MSDKIKFLHFNISAQGHNPRTFSKRMFHVWQSRTLAVLALSPHAIRTIAQDYLDLAPDTGLSVSMMVGVSFVSRDDNYSRAIGRDESTKAMKEIDMQVTSVSMNDTHINIDLAPHEGVALVLRLNRKSGFSNVIGRITGREQDRK